MNRTCLSLAVAAALGAASGALANPTGPEVVQGTATISASGRTLTVVPASGAIIDWRGFVIASDETTRFVLPAPSATVLNRIGSTAFGLYGRLESNGRLLFMQSGRVFGDGVALDLPGINVAALRQPLPARASARDVDFRAMGSMGRSVDPWVVMIVPETVPVSAGGGVLLPSGVSAELADARWPHVRVLITAPPGQPLDVAQLVRKSGALGIFGSLLAVPRGRSAEGADEALLLASAEETPLAVAPPALPDAPPAADQPIQVALRDEMPLPAPKPLASGDNDIVASVLLAMGDDDIVVPVVAPAKAPPPVPVLLAMGDDDIVVPVVAPVQARPPVPVLLAMGDDDIVVPVVASAKAPPPIPVLLAMGDDDIVVPVVAPVQARPPVPVLLAMGDDDIVVPVVASVQVRAPVPVLLAMGDDDIVVPVVASVQARPPVPVLLAMGDDDIVVPVVAPAKAPPPVPVLLAMGDDDIVVPVVASAKAPPPVPVLLAMGDDDIVVTVVASAKAPPPIPVLLAMGDDDIAAPVVAMAQVQTRPSVPLAAGDDDIVAPILALVQAPTTKTLEPVILAAAQNGTMHDAAVAEQPAAMLEARPVTIAAMQAAPVLKAEAPAAPALREPVAAAPQAVPQPAVRTVLAEPAAAPAAPVIVASAETSYRRVALAASDTPVWPAPVKLERVERRMPAIMFDRKGGIFHL